MSRIARTLGMARSLAIYHALPGRQRRLRRLYAELTAPGDLVFDIGAHAGNHVRALIARGCRVVAVEPQPDFAQLLRLFFARTANVTVVEAAVGEARGRSTLWVSDRTPTVTTVAGDWREARASDPEFARVQWNRRLEIEATTIDQLIEEFGRPAFVKLDVEGGEPAALRGLTRAVRGVAFEYLPRALDAVDASAARLEALGRYTFNWSSGESYKWSSPVWLDRRRLLVELQKPDAQRRSGDVYARLSEHFASSNGCPI